MTGNEALTIIRDAQNAFDTAQCIKSIKKEHRVNSYLIFIPLLESEIHRNLTGPDLEKIKSVKHISELMQKNYSVYKSGLIEKTEFEDNGYNLFVKLYNTVLSLHPKPKKANNMDLHSLRAGISSLNNQN